jgi:hypothetical protein
MKLVIVWLLISQSQVPGHNVIVERHVSRENCEQASLTRYLLKQDQLGVCEPMKTIQIDSKVTLGPLKD